MPLSLSRRVRRRNLYAFAALGFAALALGGADTAAAQSVKRGGTLVLAAATIRSNLRHRVRYLITRRRSLPLG